MSDRALGEVSVRAKQEANVFGAFIACPALSRKKDCIIQSELMRSSGNGEGEFSIQSGLKAIQKKDSSELQDLWSSCKSCHFNILKENGWFTVLDT